MRVLFIHQNFPGQFRHLAPALAKAGHEVKAVAVTPRMQLPGVSIERYGLPRGNAKGVHPWASDFETKAIYAEACGRKLAELKTAGFVPDIVVGHPGWGETWLVKDVWANTRLLTLQEFYYGADTTFDPEFAGVHSHLNPCRFRPKNGGLLLGLESMDWGLSPTHWQAAQFPSHYRQRLSVVFDGIDTDRVRPKAIDSLTLGSPPVALQAGDELVTFVNRNLEPYRGYHRFMRALPRLFELRPQARVILVGGDQPGYGTVPAHGTWREKFFDEVRERVDVARVHFVGKLPHATLIDLYRIACCHVYLTYPFVLSWSMIEAMSAGALVLGSRTPPVEEVIVDGENGLLVDFFDTEALAARIAEVLKAPATFQYLREAARRTVLERYALETVCLPKQLALVQAIAAGQLPPQL